MEDAESRMSSGQSMYGRTFSYDFYIVTSGEYIAPFQEKAGFLTINKVSF